MNVSAPIPPPPNYTVVPLDIRGRTWSIDRSDKGDLFLTIQIRSDDEARRVEAALTWQAQEKP